MLIRNLQAAYADGFESGPVCIRTRGREIAEIARSLHAEPNEHVIDGSHCVAVSGFVNSHHHFFQSLTRCLPEAQQSGLFDWLRIHYSVWRQLDEEMMRSSFRLAMAELLLSGCTTSCDHLYLFPSRVQHDLLELEFECAQELGIRFSALRGSMTLGKSDGGLPPDDCIERDEDVLEHCERSVKRFHDGGLFSMRNVHLAPCSPFNVTAQLMRNTAVLARSLGVRLHTHLAETTEENEFCLARYGRRPLALMQEWDWLGNDVWFAHGIHFDDAELALLAATGTGIAHCPSSNCRLGSGRMALRRMIEANIPVGLAVDGCSSNDSSNMLLELRQALLVHRNPEDREFFTARRVIDLATQGSARLLGRTDIGELKPGMAADIVLFDLNDIGYAGAGDPIAALLFCAPTRPCNVIVNGKEVVRKRALVTADEAEIAATARKQAARLLEKAG